VGGSDHEHLLPVTLFASDRDAVNRLLTRTGALRMTDGIEVRIRGRLGFYERRGTVQLRMTWIDPEYTAGRLAAERERLLATLAAEGLLETNAGLPLRVVPLRVGLVGSRGSAAVADFVHELESSGYGFRVTVADARVQGAGAVGSMMAALDELARRPLDVVALVRGGGARTDLAVFDDEVLARAIAASRLPVLTGIGHEVDHTVADVVAHTAFKTPTACAAGLVSRINEFVTSLDRHSTALARSGLRALSLAERNLVHGAARLRQASAARIRLADREVLATERRLASIATRRIERAEAALSRAEAVVAAASPTRALARGFSITRRDDGTLVRTSEGLQEGDRLVTQLGHGRVTSRVDPPTGEDV
jgi:exodeoxyribonuclease VII large subunit